MAGRGKWDGQLGLIATSWNPRRNGGNHSGGLLGKEDQEAFDRLFDRAKMHTSAGVYMSNPWPMETILLEHGKNR